MYTHVHQTMEMRTFPIPLYSFPEWINEKWNWGKSSICIWHVSFFFLENCPWAVVVEHHSMSQYVSRHFLLAIFIIYSINISLKMVYWPFSTGNCNIQFSMKYKCSIKKALESHIFSVSPPNHSKKKQIDKKIAPTCARKCRINGMIKPQAHRWKPYLPNLIFMRTTLDIADIHLFFMNMNDDR